MAAFGCNFWGILATTILWQRPQTCLIGNPSARQWIGGTAHSNLKIRTPFELQRASTALFRHKRTLFELQRLVPNDASAFPAIGPPGQGSGREADESAECLRHQAFGDINWLPQVLCLF